MPPWADLIGQCLPSFLHQCLRGLICSDNAYVLLSPMPPWADLLGQCLRPSFTNAVGGSARTMFTVFLSPMPLADLLGQCLPSFFHQCLWRICSDNVYRPFFTIRPWADLLGQCFCSDNVTLIQKQQINLATSPPTQSKPTTGQRVLGLALQSQASIREATTTPSNR